MDTPETETKSTQPSPPRKNKLTTWLIIILLLAVAGFVGYRLMNGEAGGVVATVDDTEITQEMLDARVSQVGGVQQGESEGSAEEKQALQQSVLDQMVVETLLLNDAVSQGITVSDEEVSEQYNQVVQQLDLEDAAFEELLASQGLTVESLRQSLRDQLILETYLSRIAEDRGITVSDEEVRQIYDEQIGDQESEIPFESVESQIRQQLEQQKLSEVMPDIIAELREQADIEVFI